MAEDLLLECAQCGERVGPLKCPRCGAALEAPPGAAPAPAPAGEEERPKRRPLGGIIQPY